MSENEISSGKQMISEILRTRPLSCLEQNTDVKIALIILNQPLKSQQDHLMLLWRSAVIKAATDGANNELYDLMKTNQSLDLIPDYVTGDFDSVRPEVKTFMESKGAKIIHTPDQDFTDFTKGLKFVASKIKEDDIKIDYYVAFGAFGGRLDHVLSNLNTLYEANSFLDCPLLLMGDNNLSFLLMPGSHVIEVDSGFEGDNCGLVPLGKRCSDVTTKGLKWNLQNNCMEYGGLISTCNQFAEGVKEVTIETKDPLLWTMTVKKATPERD